MLLERVFGPDAAIAAAVVVIDIVAALFDADDCYVCTHRSSSIGI